MNDKPITQERLEELNDEFSAMADSSKTPYQKISDNGKHLFCTTLDELFYEAILTEHHCFLFEGDSDVVTPKVVSIFAHKDKEDWDIIKYCGYLINIELPSEREKH